jgi:hypothetical protein
MVIMEKIKLNMIGGGFQHDICSSHGSIPKYVEWDKTTHSGDISIHVDDGIFWQVNNLKKNYALILESSAIIPHLIQHISQNISEIEKKYELIFTHDERLLNMSNKMRLVIPNAVPWVKDRGIHKKTKLISMIASIKTMCPGHNYRQSIAGKFQNKLDLFGSGRSTFIETKEQGLNDYYFSIAMENDNYPNIFCEKITDCFATGTIPIFWGTPTIGKFFNPNGIIMLTDDFKIEDISIDLYNSKMEYIKENYERAINMLTAEDFFYLNYIK